MGDDDGIEAEMGNQHGGVADKKRKKRQRRPEVVSDGSGEVSDDDPNYQYVSIVDVSYDSVSERESQVNNGDVMKCSVMIGESPNPLENGHSRVSRVSVNGDIPNGSSTKESSFIEQLGPPNGPSPVIEKVPDSSSSPNHLHRNGTTSCGLILNGLSTNEESLDSGENEISKSDVSSPHSVLDQTGPHTNGSSLIEIVLDADLSFTSVTKQIPNIGSTNNECEVLKESEISNSDSGVLPLVIDQVIPLGKSPSFTEKKSDSTTSILESPCTKTSPSDNISNGDSTNEEYFDTNEISQSETDSSPYVNGHSNGLSSTNGSTSPVERTPNGFSTPDNSLVEGSPKVPNQNGLSAEDSLEVRLARAVRETLNGLPVGVELTDGLQEEVERVVREKLKRQRSGSSDCWNHDDTDDHCIVDFLDKINDHVCF